MMTINPFSDHLYRIGSNEWLDFDVGRTIAVPDTVTMSFTPPIHNPIKIPSTSSEASPASTAPSTPPPPYTPLAWTADDLNYLLSALYPTDMLSGALVLQTCREKPQTLFSTTRLSLYKHNKATHIPTSAYAATLPIGTGRPTSKTLVAEATGATPCLAPKALAKQILSNYDKDSLAFFTTYYDILADMYTLDERDLRSLRRGIMGMMAVSDTEWVGRLGQLRSAGVDGEWGFDARFEIMLLGRGPLELRVWGAYVDAAVLLGVVERKAWARMFAEKAWFWGIVRRELGIEGSCEG